MLPESSPTAMAPLKRRVCQVNDPDGGDDDKGRPKRADALSLSESQVQPKGVSSASSQARNEGVRLGMAVAHRAQVPVAVAVVRGKTRQHWHRRRSTRCVAVAGSGRGSWPTQKLLKRPRSAHESSQPSAASEHCKPSSAHLAPSTNCKPDNRHPPSLKRKVCKKRQKMVNGVGVYILLPESSPTAMTPLKRRVC